MAYFWITEGAGAIGSTLDHAILIEYIPFIVLLFCLYVISGGIQLTGDVPARPMTNVIYLAVGALIASFIGTTGASMLLIRPILKTNRERRHKVHTIGVSPVCLTRKRSASLLAAISPRSPIPTV